MSPKGERPGRQPGTAAGGVFGRTAAMAGGAEGAMYLFLCLALFSLPMGTSPFTVCGLVGLALWLITGRFYRDFPRYLRESWFWPLALWVLLTWAGLVYSPDPGGFGLRYALKTYYWLYAFMVATLVFSHCDPQRLIRFLIAGLAINAVIGVFQLLGLLPVRMIGKYFGLASGYNTLAILLILGILMLSFYFRRAAGRRAQLYALLLMALLFFQLVILRGRGGYLTFALISPILVYNLCRGRHLVIGFLLYLLLIALMSSSPFVQERVIDSVEDIRSRSRLDRDSAWGRKYSDTEERVYMWYWATALFLERPFTGVGTGGYHQAMIERGAEKGMPHPHNNLLHMAVSFGLLGLGVFFWFFGALLRRGWLNRGDPTGFFVFSGGLVLLVGGLVDTHVLDAGPAFLLAVLTGLQAALTQGAAAEA